MPTFRERFFRRKRPSRSRFDATASNGTADIEGTGIPSVSSSVNSETVPNFPDGIKVWVESPDATTDICFVHGLTGNRDTTWTADGQQEPWPKVFLPGKLPKARLITYGYDAYVVRGSVASMNTLADHATNLLNDLTTDRTCCDASSRKIIFVAHSLGGLVCKEAILRSRNNSEIHLREVFENVIGIVFLGTPHKGSWMADWGKIPARTLGVFKSINRTLLQTLQTDNQFLNSIQTRFAEMLRGLREEGRCFEVTCFCEELPLPVIGKVVVTKESATFEAYPALSIHADHRNMAKFGSIEDNGFKRISTVLIRWGRTAALPSGGQRVASRTRDEPTISIGECLQSLSFPEMGNRRWDIEPPVKGTCAWLLSHRAYKEWTTRDQSLLWIKGKPGSGKSTLLRYALDDATANLRDGSIILSFFFHGRGVELQKTPLGFFRSLLHQLLQHAPDTLSALVTTFDDKCHSMGKPGLRWRWHVSELQDFAKTSHCTILRSTPVWIFVDALDECGKENAIKLAKIFKLMLGEYSSINSRFHICFTCRHYPIINLHHELEIRPEHENGEAISRYMNQLSTPMPSKIRKRISERAAGVFLWTRLVTDRIKSRCLDGVGWGKIEEEINIIPDDLEALYQDLVERMTDKRSSLKLIRWIWLAKEPLSLRELKWAMVIDYEASHKSLQKYKSVIVDNATFIRQIQTLSCGLVEIVHEELYYGNGIVQFIHQSVQDFFEKRICCLDTAAHSTDLAIGHGYYQLSRTCIYYLLTEEVMRYGERRDGRGYIQAADEFQLLSHATRWWVYLVKESERRGILQDDLLERLGWPSDRFIHMWAALSGIFHKHTCSWGLDKQTCLSHVVSYFSLMGPLRTILEKAAHMHIDVNPRDLRGRTPLSLAVTHDRPDVVECLLNSPEVNVNVPDNCGNAPLHLAIAGHSDNIMALLLQSPRVNVNIPDSSGNTPLHLAICEDNRRVTGLLLNTPGVNINALNNAGSTPLDLAIVGHHDDMIALLLNSPGVDVNVPDSSGDTLLHLAICQNNSRVIDLLLN